MCASASAPPASAVGGTPASTAASWIATGSRGFNRSVTVAFRPHLRRQAGFAAGSRASIGATRGACGSFVVACGASVSVVYRARRPLQVAHGGDARDPQRARRPTPQAKRVCCVERSATSPQAGQRTELVPSNLMSLRAGARRVGQRRWCADLREVGVVGLG